MTKICGRFWKNFLEVFFIFLFLIFFVVFFLYWGIFIPKNSENKEKIFSVKRGEGLFEIGENLEKEGVIKNKIFFDFYVILIRKEKNLQAGKYFLSSSMNVPQIAQKIISGDIAKMKVTIPEGFTVKEIEEKLGIKLPGENLEGYLFPDTYYFPIDVSGEEVVKIMRENFEKKISPYKEEIEKSGRSLQEIITMASLLEKEVKTKEEKEIVSGILWKRLKAGIPLQVDATITYITGKKTTKIPLEDLQIDSPYNTYKYKGLPPGPICNPGLESILAALYPKESDYWYYLSTPEGKTLFFKTLEEHNLAKAKYLK
jgi:UPF0755 protein